MPLGERCQLGYLVQTEPVGVCCVDAADKRIDESFVHFVTEPGPNERADRVVVEGGAGEERFGRRPQFAGPGEQLRACQRSDLAGHAEEQTLWYGVHAVVPHCGADRFGVRHVEV